MKKAGSIELPLHYGECPPWLFKRMRALTGAISRAIIEDYGVTELLKRLSDPLFFQSLGCLVGFDYHSSGLTTTLTGALKESLVPEIDGIAVVGGKGKKSHEILQEIDSIADIFSLSSNEIAHLKYSSRMAAKVDSSLVQDDYTLYHRCFVFDEGGNWVVIQQGMNPQEKSARRYHWLSTSLYSFVEEPHMAICSDKTNKTLDLTAKESEQTRSVSVDLVKDNPVHLSGQLTLSDFSPSRVPRYSMPRAHEVKITPAIMKALQRAYEIQPSNYEELVAIRGVGPSSLRALALTAELVYGTKPSWKDPVKYSFAHGGKDGTPFPVQRQIYDKTIRFMQDAVDQAKLGNSEKERALKRLAQLTLTW